MDRLKEYKDVLKKLGADTEVCNEIIEYTKNRFNVKDYKENEIEDEPFIEIWRRISNRSKSEDIQKVMNEEIPHGEKAIELRNPEGVSIEIYNSIAGNIPIIYAKNEEDFYEIVKKIIYRGREVKNLEKTGASFASGKNNRFIVLSNKPYSNIPADKLGLTDEQWRSFSVIIRREHECTHYFTKRFLGSSENNLHDELIADFAGILCATGEYNADWFLIGMGINEYPNKQEEGRFPVYTVNLSDKAKAILKAITIKAAKNVEKWSKSENGKNLSRNEKVLFLCDHNLLDLYLFK